MKVITDEIKKKACQCLVDNGVARDEAETVLQALGYILLDEELYPENTRITYLYRDYSNYKRFNEAIVKGTLSAEEKKG